MIIALAGRRIDAPGASPARFPGNNVERVRLRLRDLLDSSRVTALVCSAACGAGLIALEAAAEQSIARRIVLPFARELFRETSVVDRSGDWSERYDRVLAAPGSEVVVLGRSPSAPDVQPALAVVVWDGVRHTEGDITGAFGDEARRRGLDVTEIPTVWARPGV